MIRPTAPDAAGAIPDPGRNCWRLVQADRAAVVIDAEDYYRFVRQAMMEAREQILLIGWDFDTRIDLERTGGSEDGAPRRLGQFISWLAEHRPNLQIHILKWDLGAMKLLGRGDTAFRVARWAAHERIHFKLDGAHPTGGSHHQKIVVIDDRLAFCGGIDMTGSRWDTRAHRHEDPRRRRPTTRRRYMPWHDATMAVTGEAARALGELGRLRWQWASGEQLPAPQVAFDPWPEGLSPQFKEAQVAIARTRGEIEEREEVREIEQLFLDLIASAKRYVYIETQYFASRAIADAIMHRLAEQDPPEFVMVNPKTADGWLEEQVMGPARAELMKAIAAADARGNFRVYTPVTSGGEDIYVHAKIMVVDDLVLRIGSANMNNRSMGLDSECDLLIDSRLPANQGAKERIAHIRADLMAEHLGCTPEEVEQHFAETGSLIQTVELLRGEGRSLRPFTPPAFSEAQASLARSEALDPEAAGGIFEPAATPGLLQGLRGRLAWG